ncbi:heme peroxidase [Flagelloscypha sp. PMI_526]|nr:heme peroxidase [Flagelloscypha sp. PMI_526]
MRRILLVAATFLTHVIADTLNLKWPYPLDIDYADRLMTTDIQLSILDVTRDNSTVAAQWVRLAYHDMATADVSAGIGGLDASIRFELDRPENIGIGQLRTLKDFAPAMRPYCSRSFWLPLIFARLFNGGLVADLIAMGVVSGYRGRNGPLIPLRIGRVDATGAGVSGVPEPHQTLDEHTASFHRQGFTPEEMIALVACGHTLGGVRDPDFPTAHVPTSSDSNVALFHSGQDFDHNVLTEFLDGTSSNPLVVSSNSTMNSDLRIFSSDGNVTMTKLTKGDAFEKTCISLLERMINTVPKGVTLSDVIVPIKDKANIRGLFPSSTNTSELEFYVTLRLLETTDDLTVKLFWTDRRGTATCPSTGCLVNQSDALALVMPAVPMDMIWGNNKAVQYSFNANISAESSIGKFWFELSDGTKVDNGGGGYEIEQDDLLFDPNRSSKLVFDGEDSQVALVTVAVRTVAGGTSNIRLSTFDISESEPPIFSPTIHTDIPLLPSRDGAAGGYTFYSVQTARGEGVTEFDVKGTVGGIERELLAINYDDIVSITFEP